MAGPISAARRPDAGRDEERGDGREPGRIVPRQPHEIFGLDDAMKKRGLDYMWAAPKIVGQPNPRFTDFLRAGWTVAAAKDFPDHSGLAVRRDPRLIELGYLPQVDPESPVDLKGMLLLIRPAELSRQAAQEDRAAAQRQIDDWMNAQRSRSERAIGSKTRLSRSTTRGAPPADMVADTAELDEE